MSGAGTEAQEEQDVVSRSVPGLELVHMLPAVLAFLLNGLRDAAWHSTGTECESYQHWNKTNHHLKVRCTHQLPLT